MVKITDVREDLRKLALSWENQTRFDSRDLVPYVNMIEEILFHADIRFYEYVQYREEGEFPVRLKKWLDNVPTDREKKTLLSIVPFILFIDRKQMLALCQDAFKRIIVPWISEGFINRQDMLSADYEIKVRMLIKEYSLYSITESFNFPDFINVNNLSGLKKPRILGEDNSRIRMSPPQFDEKIRGLIVLEDFVGTGDQSKRVLDEVRSIIPKGWRIIFIPLIMMEKGLKLFLTKNSTQSSSIETRPVLIIPESDCIKTQQVQKEPREFKTMRALIKSTQNKVLEPLDKLDDPPNNPFGYRGSGTLIVTCHNTPNNTIPLIHHRSPEWSPLFRRVHHSKDGLR